MYSSLRSRCVLVVDKVSLVAARIRLLDGGDDQLYLCACRLSSCLRVRAGLLSGFGPRLFAGCPSLVNFFSAEDLEKPSPLRRPFLSSSMALAVEDGGPPYATAVPTPPNPEFMSDGGMDEAAMLARVLS